MHVFKPAAVTRLLWLSVTVIASSPQQLSVSLLQCRLAAVHIACNGASMAMEALDLVMSLYVVSLIACTRILLQVEGATVHGNAVQYYR